MPNSPTAQELDLMRRWVAAWRDAGEELDEIRRREIVAADTCKAVEQIFGSEALPDLPPRLTSGLVEQQAWFAMLRPRLRQ